MAKLVWRFVVDLGRMGRLDSVFTAEEDAVFDAIGKRVYFGEILGKHSDIDLDLRSEDFVKLCEEPQMVEAFERFSFACGYNPLEFLAEAEEEGQSD